MAGIGAMRIATALRSRFTRAVPILAYHRILDVPNEDEFPFDVELVSASVSAFAEQMTFLKDHYQPITLSALLSCVDDARPPPRGAIVVTFDDGFADNYYNAFPILRRLGIPATIFLPTGYLDRQQMFWYEKLTHDVMTTRATQLRLLDEVPLSIGEDAPSRRSVLAALLRRLKRVPNQVRLDCLSDLERQLSPAVDCNGDPRSGPMNWEQVAEMARAGIEFGSHSVTHPVLSMLDPPDLDFELRASKASIEAATGNPCQTIAYPVGGREAFNPRVQQAVQAAGYRLGLSYVSGVDVPADWDPFALRRLHVERYTGTNRFRAMLAAPALFA
jgi:peptidoglycan/xylan/chitin deacetylase (PgdA/CDA1 family)